MPDVMSLADVSLVLDEELPSWTYVDGGLVRSAERATYAEGIALVDAVAVVADELNHHPDIDIRWTTVTFRLTTHAAGGVTSYDVELAHRIDELVDAR